MNKHDLFNIPDIVTKEVTVPEWNNAVLKIKQMTNRELTKFYKFLDQLDAENRREESNTWLIIHSVVDDEGKPVFDKDDFDKLNEKSFSAIVSLADQIVELNSLDKKKVEDQKKD